MLKVIKCNNLNYQKKLKNYIVSGNIENTKSLVDGKVGWVDIPENRSMDIDNLWDLELSRLIYQNKLYEKKI